MTERISRCNRTAAAFWQAWHLPYSFTISSQKRAR
jgi:hypothetical protein